METQSWEPIDFLAEYHERAALCREVIDLLMERSGDNNGLLWLPHIPQMIDAADYILGLLEDEIEHFGEWRYHELQHDEILDFIDDEMCTAGAWLCRMTNTTIPQHSDES
jgi:hypothetical protein